MLCSTRALLMQGNHVRVAFQCVFSSYSQARLWQLGAIFQNRFWWTRNAGRRSGCDPCAPGAKKKGQKNVRRDVEGRQLKKIEKPTSKKDDCEVDRDRTAHLIFKVSRFDIMASSERPSIPARVGPLPAACAITCPVPDLAAFHASLHTLLVLQAPPAPHSAAPDRDPASSPKSSRLACYCDIAIR